MPRLTSNVNLYPEKRPVASISTEARPTLHHLSQAPHIVIVQEGHLSQVATIYYTIMRSQTGPTSVSTTPSSSSNYSWLIFRILFLTFRSTTTTFVGIPTLTRKEYPGHGHQIVVIFKSFYSNSPQLRQDSLTPP